MGFQRFKSSSKPTPPGCRISTLNGQILTSTGIASLDEMMAGGMPLGRVLMIKQDRFTGYAHLILKYWIAQGIAHKQSVGVAACLDAVSLEEYLVDLMSIVEGKQESTKEEQDFIPQMSGVGGGRALGALRTSVSRPDQNLDIAWRYQGLPQVSASLSAEFKGPNSTTQF